jgi:hypothetical protein
MVTLELHGRRSAHDHLAAHSRTGARAQSTEYSPRPGNVFALIITGHVGLGTDVGAGSDRRRTRHIGHTHRQWIGQHRVDRCIVAGVRRDDGVFDDVARQNAPPLTSTADFSDVLKSGLNVGMDVTNPAR